MIPPVLISAALSDFLTVALSTLFPERTIRHLNVNYYPSKHCLPPLPPPLWPTPDGTQIEHALVLLISRSLVF